MDLTTVFWIVAGVMGLGVLVCGAIALAAYRSVMGMSGPDLALEMVEGGDHELESAVEDHAWAESNGFAWEGAYRMEAPGNPVATIFAWRLPGEARFFCMYRMAGRRFVDFVTIYSERDECGLTTGSTADGLIHPVKPRAYRQAFPGKSLDELWAAHQRAEEYLRGVGMPRDELSGSFEEVFVGAIGRQMEHVRSHAGWALRFVWWYFTRGCRANKGVWEGKGAGV